MALWPVAILVPVLARPWRVGALIASIEEATPGPHRIVFLCTETDHEEIAAIEACGCEPIRLPGPRMPGDWARKVNAGYRQTTEELMLLAADDVRFHPMWHDIVDEWAKRGYGVVGTQDLGNPRVLGQTHSTHPVVARWYADTQGTIDGPGQVVTEVYGHNFVDDELVWTAKKRHTWTFAPGAIVEHLHPNWRKAPHDQVYDLGMSSWHEDKATFMDRRKRWM